MFEGMSALGFKLTFIKNLYIEENMETASIL
jgi:hypothetical protein